VKLYVRERESVLPAAFTLSLREVLDTPGPFWVALTYWTAVTDAGAGNFSASVRWTDPIGQVRTVAGGNVNLNAAGAIATIDPFLVRCQSGSSPLDMLSTYAGSPGAARYSYSLSITSAASDDIERWQGANP
jgi:hypothetical protein